MSPSMLKTPSTMINLPYPLQSLEDTLQVFDVVVAVFLHLSKRKAAPINDACVIILVDNSHVTSTQQGGDGPQVGLVPGGKDNGRFLPKETCQLLLQFFVDFKGPVEEP